MKKREGTQVYLSEAPILRSVFFFFKGTGHFSFDAGVIKPYSFTLVNQNNRPILFGKVGTQILVAANGAMAKHSLDFPGVGYYTRDDVLKFNGGAFDIVCYIRAEINIANIKG